MTSTTTYLITGANRGIGRGLAEHILARPNTTLIALVRNPEDESVKSLRSAAAETTAKLIVLPYEATDHHAAEKAVALAQRDHGITRLDVVIANAGVLSWRGPTIDTPPGEILKHVTVNTIGPLRLFRACLPLMQRGGKTDIEERGGHEEGEPSAKFIAISSVIGSTERLPQFHAAQTLPYGLSKAALNHTTRKLSVDHPDLIIELFTPGPVSTDLMRDFSSVLQAALKANPQLADRFMPLDKVTEGLLALIDTATKETSGGFRDWKGEVIPW
ncbi:hypothetical protein HRR83_000389 [Exophiala dermatitidis]|uniref:Uncharacterized protein n=1 Tax=Exophiala dermatitidis TaxID=5970 RepID=A0AAN6F1A8_EXODE|nr:hypothetical protein HRR74_000391 [Exophiala dermatitidis]KAJ4528272.1 hypothetical protein HRR73_000895 [Exophiala dermatitidis]KAJ4531215.1 hypothetical protein HRR76_008887 [Exophiala dermatitidis]KAJ4558380.1 hypothetical protein HRR77_000390 [Exophiala dermatitidis]KAJ4581584.1 hypothetical protein HRR79_000604 [Exophiala dermatitidis]